MQITFRFLRNHIWSYFEAGASVTCTTALLFRQLNLLQRFTYNTQIIQIVVFHTSITVRYFTVVSYACHPPSLLFWKKDRIVLHLSVGRSVYQVMSLKIFWPLCLKVAKPCTVDAHSEYMFSMDGQRSRSDYWSFYKCCLLSVFLPLCLKVATVDTVDAPWELIFPINF